MSDTSLIPTTEILQDIVDTQREIDTMKQELTAFELIPRASSEFRMAQFRASNRRIGIQERREFIAKLRKLLALRNGVV